MGRGNSVENGLVEDGFETGAIRSLEFGITGV